MSEVLPKHIASIIERSTRGDIPEEMQAELVDAFFLLLGADLTTDELNAIIADGRSAKTRIEQRLEARTKLPEISSPLSRLVSQRMEHDSWKEERNARRVILSVAASLVLFNKEQSNQE